MDRPSPPDIQAVDSHTINELKGHEKKTKKFLDKKNMPSLMKHIPNGKKSDK